MINYITYWQPKKDWRQLFPLADAQYNCPTCNDLELKHVQTLLPTGGIGGIIFYKCGHFIPINLKIIDDYDIPNTDPDMFVKMTKIEKEN